MVNLFLRDLADEALAERISVLPGYCLLREVKIGSGEQKTSGGIVIPGKAEEFAKLLWGVVVKAGLYCDHRGIALYDVQVPTGVLVGVHPGANTWRLEPIGANYFICKMTDLMLEARRG